MKNKFEATLTYFCMVNRRMVVEYFTDRTEAKKQAMYLSKNNLAKYIKIINHSN